MSETEICNICGGEYEKSELWCDDCRHSADDLDSLIEVALGDDMNHWELGYTPENLKRLMKKNRVKRSEVAEWLNVSLGTVSRWKRPVKQENHSDMPMRHWDKLVAIIQKMECRN